MSQGLYRRGTTWWGRCQIAGREHRRSLRTGDRTEARRRFAAWRKELESARFGLTGETFPEAVTRWTAEYLPTVKPSTAERYKGSARQLYPHLRHLSVAAIDQKAIVAYISARRADGAGDATIRRDLTALSRILACAVAWGWRPDNPARVIDRALLRERRDPISPPSARAVAAVILRAPPMAGRLLAFLSLTGMRLGEATGLTWERVNLELGEARLVETKTGRPRVVPLSPQALDVLQDTPRSGSLVFWHSRGGTGQPFRNAPTYLAKLVRAAGQRFRIHDLRHRFAIEYLRAGGDIYRLSGILGHSSVKTTEIYLGHVGTKTGTAKDPW